MSTTTTVHLLRHGEVYNPRGILYGRLEGFGLSDKGHEQAHLVSSYVTDWDITALYASPLQRAQETAAPTAAALGLDITTADQLIEADNDFEGQQVAGSGGALRDRAQWGKLRDPFTPSWGEPYIDIGRRMLGVLYQVKDQARGHEALCVSHQLPIYTTRRLLEGKRLWHDPRSRECSLASITSFTFDGDTLIDISYCEPAGASDPGTTGA